MSHKAHRVDADPLLRVAFCAIDGAPPYTTGDPDANHRYRYYRCSLSSRSGCTGRNVPAEALEQWTATAFLGQVGAVEIVERIPVPAEDHTRELAEVEEAIANLDAEYSEGRLVARTYSRMVSALEDKLPVCWACSPGNRPLALRALSASSTGR